MFISAPADIGHTPKRIISTVPSLTELLFYLGLGAETAGITKFCVHPEEWFRSKPRVGGTKQLNIDKIISLQPDLVICNKEENVQERVEALAKIFPVYLTDVKNFEDALQMIRFTGALTAKQTEAEKLIGQIEKNFAELNDLPEKKIRTAYLIWKDPYMTVGGDTFISAMMEKAGFENIYRDEARYPEINLTELESRKPELLLLSSEPYPFKEKHLPGFKQFLPNTRICIADGEMFSWYGSRLLYAAPYFKKLKTGIGL